MKFQQQVDAVSRVLDKPLSEKEAQDLSDEIGKLVASVYRMPSTIECVMLARLLRLEQQASKPTPRKRTTTAKGK